MTETRCDGVLPPRQVAPPAVRAAGPESARRRLFNLLSRHPDLVEGRLGRVAAPLCRELAELSECRHVGLWQLRGSGGRELVEVAFNGVAIEELAPRRLERALQSGFFASLELRRLFAGDELHAAGLNDAYAAVVLVRGQVWGLVTFEGAQRPSISDLDLDLGLIVAEMIGRALERGGQRQTEVARERAEEALSVFTRLADDALCFELRDGELHFLSDPRLLIGPAPRGESYRWPDLAERIPKDELELLQRRYSGWVRAGAPGVLAMRFHYRPGGAEPSEGQAGLELTCRLMNRSTDKVISTAAPLWGLVRRG